MLKVGYGYNVTGADDPLIATAERCLTQIGETFELGRFLVEFIPPRGLYVLRSDSDAEHSASTTCPGLVSWRRLEAHG